MGQAGEKGEGYLDGAYFSPLEKEMIEKYRATQFRLSILEEEMPIHEKKNIAIVRSEKELIKKLEEGYEIVRELSDGRIILKKYF